MQVLRAARWEKHPRRKSEFSGRPEKWPNNPVVRRIWHCGGRAITRTAPTARRGSFGCCLNTHHFLPAPPPVRPPHEVLPLQRSVKHLALQPGNTCTRSNASGPSTGPYFPVSPSFQPTPLATRRTPANLRQRSRTGRYRLPRGTTAARSSRRPGRQSPPAPAAMPGWTGQSRTSCGPARRS